MLHYLPDTDLSTEQPEPGANVLLTFWAEL